MKYIFFFYLSSLYITIRQNISTFGRLKKINTLLNVSGNFEDTPAKINYNKCMSVLNFIYSTITLR